MSKLEELIDVAGDEAKQVVKKEMLNLISEAKSETADAVKEAGDKIEKLLIDRVEGKIDNDRLKMHLNAVKSTLEQFLNTQEIKTRSRIEKFTVDLIEFIKEKAIDAIL